MNRTGLLIAAALAVFFGLLFGLYPGLDLKIAGYFAGKVPADTFPLRADFWLSLARESAMWIVGAFAAPPIIALVLKLIRPRARMLIPGRAVVFLLATLALAPGLLVNGMLKQHWSRPRPIDVTQFGGAERFVPWWDPRGTCPDNCSFVSGDAAGAYWTLAPAALAPAPWRPLAVGVAIAFGTSVGFLRVVFGGHFPSDVIFAGLFTFLIVWIVYALLYRRPETQNGDAAIEHAIERITLPVDTAVRGLFGHRSEPDKP
jgi:lipid A 4'-phosphatase